MLALITTLVVCAVPHADAPTVERAAEHVYYATNAGPAVGNGLKVGTFRQDERSLPMMFEGSVGYGQRDEGTTLNLSAGFGGPVRHARLRVGVEQLLNARRLC